MFKHVPVVNRVICDQSQTSLAEPLPENNIFIHGRRLELDLLRKVEDLYRPGLGLERNDLLIPMHDGTIGLDRSPHDLIAFLEVDDDDFRRCFFTSLLTHTDIVVGL